MSHILTKSWKHKRARAKLIRKAQNIASRNIPNIYKSLVKPVTAQRARQIISIVPKQKIK